MARTTKKILTPELAQKLLQRNVHDRNRVQHVLELLQKTSWENLPPLVLYRDKDGNILTPRHPAIVAAVQN